MLRGRVRYIVLGNSTWMCGSLPRRTWNGTLWSSGIVIRMEPGFDAGHSGCLTDTQVPGIAVPSLTSGMRSEAVIAQQNNAAGPMRAKDSKRCHVIVILPLR